MIEENNEQLLKEIIPEAKEKVLTIEKESIFFNGLNIGTVETGDEAKATITGNAPNQKLNLVLPRGSQGIDGTDGKDGVSVTTISAGDPTEENGSTITPITFYKSDGTDVVLNIIAKNGTNGINGQNGIDGTTPTIGENGNWYLGDTDTTKPSRGEQGAAGVSILSAVSGTASENESYTITPITFNLSDGTSSSVNISAKNGKNITIEKKWENTNNKISFSSGNITISNISDYRYLIINYNSCYSNSNNVKSCIITIPTAEEMTNNLDLSYCCLSDITLDGRNRFVACRRPFNINKENNNLQFYSASAVVINDPDYAFESLSLQAFLIPLNVYGVKL